MRGAALLLLAALICACATPAARFAAPPLPADAQEVVLLTRVARHDDPHLAALVARVTAALLVDGEGIRVILQPVVVHDPTIAAYVLPSGRIVLHTGLLARLSNEAQLATILARALTHAGRRHALAREPSGARVDEALLALPPSMGPALAAPVTDVAVLSPVAEAILGGNLTVVFVAAMTGYDREVERAADAGALRRLVRAGYDPKEAPKVFQRLRREARAGGPIERFFLGNDAALAERVETLARLLADDYAVAAAAPDTVTTTRDFEETMALVARDNARLEVRIGRFRAAQEQLDRALAIWPADALAHFTVGELLRLRAQRARGAAERDELARLALAAYDRAARFDPALVDVARHVGLLYYQQGQLERAREAFTRYLALSPDAPEAARVREYLAALGPPAGPSR